MDLGYRSAAVQFSCTTWGPNLPRNKDNICGTSWPKESLVLEGIITSHGISYLIFFHLDERSPHVLKIWLFLFLMKATNGETKLASSTSLWFGFQVGIIVLLGSFPWPEFSNATWRSRWLGVVSIPKSTPGNGGGR